jgi:DNA/RNA-binding domain of Phe-tRNA-synthetase-like protein
MQTQVRVEAAGVSLALVEALDCQVVPADAALRATCDQTVAEVLQQDTTGGDARRTAIRDLLRAGGYRPAGRNKPAQEYLLRTVRETGRLPEISNAVDLINRVSLASGLPISLVSLDRIGTQLSVRLGRQGESYVFNRAGQELDAAGLLCLAADREGGNQPVGSPVKDSMLAKVDGGDRRLLACIFASPAAVTDGELTPWAEQLAEGFARHCGATQITVELLPNRAWHQFAPS